MLNLCGEQRFHTFVMRKNTINILYTQPLIPFCRYIKPNPFNLLLNNFFIYTLLHTSNYESV